MHNYRFDIQFMRGVAVLAVVAFHGFPGVFGRGYLGVDVFFVISGFLVGRSILSGLESRDGFSFKAFYLRRAWRLLPASLTTLAVTTCLAQFILTRSQLAEFGMQLAGSLTFLANFALAAQTGYFEGAAETKPLLHIWSLSLEEQFYFLAPLLLWLTPCRQRPWLLIAATVASFALCVIFMTGPSWLPFSSKGAQKLAFFMLPTRAWELLVGTLCAWVMLRRPDLRIPDWVKWLALLTIPGVFIVGPDPVHPRFDALVVVVCTAVILLGGDGWLPRLVSPVAKVGDWSYSVYLVHWPLFAFAFVLYGEAPPLWAMVGLTVFSLWLGWLQWRFVEQTYIKGWPHRRFPAIAPLPIVACVFGTVPLMATSATGDVTQLSPAHGLSKSCDNRGDRWEDRAECRTSSQPVVAVLGDSYAMHLVPGLQGVPLVQMTKSACAPVEGLAQVSSKYTEAWARECVAFNADALGAIENMPSVRYVVLSSIFGQVFPGEGHDLMVDGRLEPTRDQAVKGLSRTLDRLKAAGKIPIIVGPTPRASFDAGACNQRAIERKPFLGRGHCDIPDDLRDPAGVYRHLRAAAELSGVILLDPATVLCEGDYCRTRRGDILLYKDRGHLTSAGSHYVVGRLGLVDRLRAEPAEQNDDAVLTRPFRRTEG